MIIAWNETTQEFVEQVESLEIMGYSILNQKMGRVSLVTSNFPHGLCGWAGVSNNFGGCHAVCSQTIPVGDYHE